MHSNHLQPEELTAVKDIYDAIVAQDWFDSREESRISFARYLLDAYSISAITARRFRSIVECSARWNYGKRG